MTLGPGPGPGRESGLKCPAGWALRSPEYPITPLPGAGFGVLSASAAVRLGGPSHGHESTPELSPAGLGAQVKMLR